MTKISCWIAVFLAGTILPRPSLGLDVLHTFNSTIPAAGYAPVAGLIQASDGDFYGTTRNGGTNGECGTVFKISPDGMFRSLASFNVTNGLYPSEKLLEGSDGNFYGTTEIGGTNNLGTVFKMTPTGTITTLVTFDGANGDTPSSQLIRGFDGNYYGTTFYGAPDESTGFGTIFKMTAAGNLTTLAYFANTNGSYPTSLVQAHDGNFYGTTFYGGLLIPALAPDGYGTVFKMTPKGDVTTLVMFDGLNGLAPDYGLVEWNDDNFYGIARFGGTNLGTAFKVTPDGELTILTSFNSTPITGLTKVNDGLYGALWDGTIYRICADGTVVNVCRVNPRYGTVLNDLVQGTDGNLYVTAQTDAQGLMAGTIFRVWTTLVPRFVGDHLSVAWSTNALGATLQCASDLALDDWADITNAPSIEEDRFVITAPCLTPHAFYRLKQ